MSDIRMAIIGAARAMLESRLVNSTWGNISAKEPDERECFWITPSGMDYRKLTPEDLVLVHFSGEVIKGRRKPSSETPMHALIHCERPEIGAIVHTHSLMATVIGVLGREIPPVIAELAAGVGGPVPLAPFALFGTRELGEVTLTAMADRRAVLLQNHGVVTIGSDLDEAVRLAAIVEDAAAIYYYASLAGKPVLIPATSCAQLHRIYQEKYGQK
jgi:L-fuculose-phosphate aldolase